jgi:hypothetical protein
MDQMIHAKATYEIENSRRECGIPPSGDRRDKILDQLREPLCSVARQVGVKELLKFVRGVMRQVARIDRRSP